MNEQENTRLVQQFYQSQKTGDMESVLNFMARDVQWVVPEMENVPFAGTWEGCEGVGKFFSIVSEVQDVVGFEPQEYIAQGNKVVVLGRFTMRIKRQAGMSVQTGRTSGRLKMAKLLVSMNTLTRLP